jgi:hypothetical protein
VSWGENPKYQDPGLFVVLMVIVFVMVSIAGLMKASGWVLEKPVQNERL